MGQWLPEAAGRVEGGAVVGLPAGMRPATRQRAAYLLGAGGNDQVRAAIVDRYPVRAPVWFGPRVAGVGSFDPRTQVNDTVLHT